jgi:preprotein translocase subunit SecF
MRRLFTDANYDYIGSRRRAYMGSGLAILLTLAFAVFWHVKTGSAFKYGVDFTGGSLMQAEIKKPTTEAEMRQILAGLFPEGGTEAVRSTGTNGADQYMLRTPAAVDGDQKSADQNAARVRAALTEKFGADGFTMGSAQNVSPKVGGELTRKALIAILISFAATLLYLAVRFEWRFGLAAVLATVHDIILTIGVIIIFRMDVSLDAVAAVLTIVGYSLNDTVIIFDRIREHVKGRRSVDLTEMLNLSINETLPRTVLTISTTLATLFALFLLGGDIIRTFATILIIGILLGAYSSIFVASPALLEIERKWPRKIETKTRKSGAPGAVRA